MPTVHCKKCNNKEFADVSSLRKHQWKEHKEFYSKLMQPTPKKSKAKQNGYVSAEELLDKLKSQRNFMNDIVTLVEGMLKR